MNKKIILPLALVALMVLAMVGAASAASADDEVTTVDKLEIRGEVIRINPSDSPNERIEWNATNFAGFWYDLDDDLMTETLWIDANVLNATANGAGEDRTIDEDRLWYHTSPMFQEYELHENEADPTTVRDNMTAMEYKYRNITSQNIGLCVESDLDGGDCGYFIEGFMAQRSI
jgi:opacity protein-like surface antigen